jgi:hypothetical protein
VNRLLERALVAVIVVAAIGVALRALLPFAWRVRLARALQGRVPDRVLIWVAGRQGCDACDGRPPPGARR